MRSRIRYQMRVALVLLLGVLSVSLNGCVSATVHSCEANICGPPMPLKYPLVTENSEASTILDPARANDQASRTVVSLLYDGVVTLDQRLQVDVSGDGLTYTFHLRSSLAFADGTPVTAEDYAYSINRALDPCVGSPLACDLYPIKDAATFASQTCAHGQIEVNAGIGQTGPVITTLLGGALQTPDDHTLVIILAQPASYFLAALTSPAALALDPTLVGPDATSEQWPHQLDSGRGSSGMFHVTEWDPQGGSLILKANQHWWGFTQGKKMFLDQIDVTVFDSMGTAYAAYKAGQFHLGFPTPDQLAQAQTRPDFHEVGALDYHGLSVNWTRLPLNNLDARQALCLAVDRDALNSAALGGSVIPGWHIIPSGMPGFNPTSTGPDGVASTQGDVAGAGHHWASYRAAGAGAGAAVPPIVYTFDRDDPIGLAAAKTLQNQWRQALRIQVVLRGESHAAWQHDIDSGNYMLSLMRIEPDYPDPRQFLSQPFLHTSDAPFPDVPQADALMSQADASNNLPVRLQQYQQAEQLLVHNVVTCPLYQSQFAYLVRQCVHGLALGPMGIAPLDIWSDTYIDRFPARISDSRHRGGAQMRLEVVSREPEMAVAGRAPLLFVHGAWHGAWCWEDHFLPYFAAEGYSAHALSLRGHGNSERPRQFKTMRIAQYVADVAEVAERFSTPPVLIGHSMGGLVVQKYLERHPATGAVLLASVPTRGVLRTTVAIAARHPLRFARGNLTWSLLPLVNTTALTREAFFTRATDEALVRAALPHIQDESYWAFLDMIAFSLPRPARVLRHSVPLLVMGASGDGIFTPAEIRRTARAYRTEAEIFPELGHDMMLDGGWQAVADRVLVWLRERL